MVSVDEMWEGLTPDSKKSVCNGLAMYSGSNVRAWFPRLVELVHAKQLATGSMTQFVTNEKRKRDDGDVAQTSNKKPKLGEATTSLEPNGLNIASLTLRDPLLRFGQPTISSATAVTSRSIAPPSPAIPLTTNPPANPASSTAKPAVVLGRPTSVKPENPANPPRDCDEQFTIADRRSSGPQPYTGPGTTHGTNPSARNNDFGQSPAPSFTANPQGTLGTAAVSTIYKTPSTGVDMSSLKIPANSNVSLTMNVFQAPSSLHQKAAKVAPRKLKCIQCKAFYLETQNTAKECHRHTGRCLDVEDEKFYFQSLPYGAYRVWDCCRRTAHSQGCFPCNHYAG